MHKFRLKFAIRALMRNKVYTFLNVMGLAIGLGVCIVIFLYVQSELTYDRSIPHHEEIYRVSSEFVVDKQEEEYGGAGVGLAPLLQREFPFIEGATRLIHIDESVLFKRHGFQSSDDHVALADRNYFKVFEIPLIVGDPETALLEPQSVVVTRPFAEKYFGEGNPVGKRISTNNYQYTVTGLIDDFPSNTHHSYSALISSFYQKENEEEWKNSLWQIEAYTFLRLNRSYEAFELEASFGSFYEKYMAESGKGLKASYQIKLTRLDKVHFADPVKFDRPAGNKGYLYAFSGIGLLILILACINYINMATIRGLRRVREAGMQKVLGAGKREIVYQVLIESFVLAAAALLVALVLVELILELTILNEVMGKDLSLNFIHYPALWWLPLG
ncbi:MAG: ABC transporter permease, partial [Owenweeksia sp.]